MDLLKSKYYPVDPSRQLILLDPLGRECDVRDKWGRGKHVFIGLTGAHISRHACYTRYRLMPVVTQASLIERWHQLAESSSDLWRHNALRVIDALSIMPAAEALQYCQKQLKANRRMAASLHYERAIRDIRSLIKQSEIATAHNAPLPDPDSTSLGCST